MSSLAGSGDRRLTATRMLLGLLLFSVIAWPASRGGSAGLAIGLILATPLALLAWKLRKPSRRTLQAGILLQGLYLLVGVTELIANPAARPWALATSLASLVLCASLLSVLRRGVASAHG